MSMSMRMSVEPVQPGCEKHSPRCPVSCTHRGEGPEASASPSSQCREAQKKDVVAELRRHRALQGRCAIQKSLRNINTHTEFDEPPRGGPQQGRIGFPRRPCSQNHTQQARGGGRWAAGEKRTPRHIFCVRDTRKKIPERCPTLHGRLPNGPHVSR